MPTVKRFARCRIAMYFNDHAPPHFHILTNDRRAGMYEIETLACLAGSLERADTQEALTWALTHRERLWELWAQYCEEE
jgi:hypothetical protein